MISDFGILFTLGIIACSFSGDASLPSSPRKALSVRGGGRHLAHSHDPAVIISQTELTVQS